ncbi:MAG: DUF4258 domain-containing protein [Acidobacteria bacterium]|nr:DUF4258 domain-containing protein [Acidobacteriota bacterium]MBV9145174.1 DUF4258 domain-containing protein [Acidobacteriota bacterium]MBV9434566.1 DUF4258 domain-containing protein [Acidobacteriota bacterium]
MSRTLDLIRELVGKKQLRISEHGYDELSKDGITFSEVLKGFEEAILVEDYPEYLKGPCVLVLQRDSSGDPMHVVWGIARNTQGPAVLVTAYRPDPKRWSPDFRRRL